MTYRVLARKWRPQRFADLIGQEPIVTALQNALTEERIAQAYLFSGIRGVGKTSAARLLAKALNCERGPTAEPCNECTACVEITRGADMDVIEVDAATYSKVEQVRDLTESLKYGPARDRYKVVVLDEIHRLSRQAFDALLKIVEEPPDHLVFIFATTEVDAVPATVLSRCQEFSFRRVPADALARHLAAICEAEEITASDTARRLIARAGEGSVRDSVALLDQLATFGSGAISEDDAARLLGGLDTGLLHSLIAAVLASDAGEVSGLVRRLEDEGWDPRQAFVQLLSYCRDALHLAMGREPAEIDLPIDDAEALADTARQAGYENLLRLLHQLLGSEAIVRRSEAPFLALEIAWLRAAELPKLTRVEELLGGAPPRAAAEPPKDRTQRPEAASPKLASPPRQAAPRPAAETPSAAQAPATQSSAAKSATARPAAGQPAAAEPVAEKAPAAEASPEPSPKPSGPPATSSAPVPAKGVGGLLELVGRRKQPLAAHLSEAQSLRVEDGKLLVFAPPGDTWLERALSRRGNREVLDEAVAAVWGEEATWELREGSGEDAPASSATERDSAAKDAADGGESDAAVGDDPTVQAVLDLFQGRVEAVEELAPGEPPTED